MDFQEKLTLLMDLFSVSNSQLARKLKIDPSLVSKWRHGDRMPARNASYIKELVHYFSQRYHESEAMLQHRFRRLLGESAEVHMDDSEMAVQQLLLEWLNPAAEPTPRESKKLAGDQGQHVIQMMQQIFNLEASLPAGENLGVQPETQAGGSLRQYHLHTGKAGRRKAVIEFLDMVLAMESPQELLLLSQEDLSWMTENREFMEVWKQKLMAVLVKGHQVTIIHHMDRREEDLFSIMQYWIPLHLTGNVRSWHFPRYVEIPQKSTYFIIRNHAAIFATANEGTRDENNVTFFFRDPLVARVLEASYQIFLDRCVPLVKVFPAHRMEAFMTQLTELEEEAGTYIGWKNGLSGASLSVSLYEQLLIQAGIGGADRWKRLQLHQRRQEAFRKNILHFSYIEVLPLSLLNSISRTPGAVLSPLEGFTERPLKLQEEQAASLLESMVERLQKYPNYEVYLANANPLWKEIEMSLGYKENLAALAASLGPSQQRPAALLTGEGNMTMVFEGFLETALQSIPSSLRNRRRVMERIQKAIAFQRQHARSNYHHT